MGLEGERGTEREGGRDNKLLHRHNGDFFAEE